MQFEATKYYENAARCYKSTDLKACMETYKMICEITIEAGRLNAAAKIYKGMGLCVSVCLCVYG